MANDLAANPIILDTDVTSFAALWKTQFSKSPSSWRIRRFALVVGTGGSSSAGHVDITNKASTRALYEPLLVPASLAARSIVTTDGPWTWDDTLAWPDFAVTGLTATGTQLYLWVRNS